MSRIQRIGTLNQYRCDFDENYYAYYSDLETEGEEGYFAPLYIGGNMSDNNRPGKLFIISGPSGVGKTTLAHALLLRLEKHYNLHRVVTYTTKEPRKGERHGVDYYFITEAEFELKLATGFFIEYSKVYGHYYGSPRTLIDELNLGKSFVLIVDQLGAYKIKEQFAPAVLIWITPPSLDELISRLHHRATETDLAMQKRLMIAHHEIKTELQRQLFDYVVENNILEEAIINLMNIFKAEMTSGSINC